MTRKAKPRTRHADDWYVEPRWAVEAIADVLAPKLKASFRRRASRVWDPACGSGTIPQVFRSRGVTARGSDIVDRDSGEFFLPSDFLSATCCPDQPFEHPGLWSIISNPPYRQTEAFVRHALTLAHCYVAVLVPNNWLASQVRHAFFTSHPPSMIAYLSQRPSMPRGDLVTQLGSKAFKNGKIDYCWVIWNVRRPAPVTRAIWLAPRKAS